jgi:sugar phosphate isomerase/epimerase
MKLGCLVNWTENLEVWAKVADALEIEGIDYTFATKDEYVFDAGKINEILKNRRVKLCAASMFHVNTIDKDSQKRAWAREQNEKLIQFAADTKAPVAVINPGLLEGAGLEENISEFKKEFEHYKAFSEKRGVEMTYYLGHDPNFIKSDEALGRVLEAIPDMHVKVDPVGVMRNMDGNPYKIVSKYAARINHFHCKDIIRKENYEIEPPVGLGDLHWNEFIAMLYEVDYDGYLVIEPHGPKWKNEERMGDYIKLSKRHLAQYIL